MGGTFTTLGGQTRNRIARLNADGTLDSAFNPGADNTVNSLAVQADGKILVGGNLGNLGGQPRNRIGRLNADGTVDSAFNTGAGNTINSLAVQADGKILVGGNFGNLGGQLRSYLARLNADGSVDGTFNPGAGNSVSSLALQADGKILVGGNFTTLGGQTRNRIARLNADGTLDSAFNPGADNMVNSLALQADGKILVGGVFTNLGGQTRNYLARLNADGTLDSAFNPGADNMVNSLAVQADGKILVGGNFTTLGGQTRNRIARLNADGTLDSSFNPGADNEVYSVALQADGKILVGGNFTTLGGRIRNRIARLLNDEATSTLSITDTSQIDWQRGGSTAEVEQVTFDFWNGAGWTTAGTGVRFAGGWRATGLSLPASTWVRARGRTGGGQYNSSSGLIEQIVSYGGGSYPDLEVTLNGGNAVSNGLGRLDFGSVAWRQSATNQTVTLTNTGTAPLTGLSLALVGPATGDFGVTPLGTTTLAPGQSTNITVSFTASDGGDRSASLRILSNDGDESPFEVLLVGRGLRNDETFNPGASSGVYALALQADGKILVGGSFTSLGGQTRNRIARLNADGTLDNSFNPGANGDVTSLALQADGKILVGGWFTTLGGQTRNYLARLNADGTLDSTFNSGANSWVYSLALQADDKILVGGNFTTLGGQVRNYIARLNADGSLDSTFNPGAGNTVTSLALQADGKILVGGSFMTLGGQTRNRIARLNADGTLDSTFNPGANGSVTALAVQADGKILVGGNFGNLGGQTRNRIARLNADGTVDSTFNPGVTSSVTSLAVQADGKVLVGGNFSALGGQPRNSLARLNANGTVDGSFNPGANNSVYSLAVQADGKIFVGGIFTTLGGQTRNRIARLLNDEATSTLSITDTSQIDWQRGGSTAEVEQVTFDFWNGAGWTAAGTGARFAGGWRAAGLSLPASTWVRVRGRTGGGFNTGSSGLIEQIVSYGGGSYPDLEVTLNGGNPVGNGLGRLDFGSVAWRQSATNQTVTLTNTGTAPLTGLSVDLAGAAVGDFGVSALGTTTLAPGQSTGVTVSFTALDGGERGASLRFLSNDADESPFEVSLVGLGLRNDSSFNPGANGSVISLALQPDGKILVGGDFTTLGGQTRNRIAQLNADGTLDSSFNPEANNTVSTLAVQGDGKILVGGDFTTLGGEMRNYLARLNADGTLDSSFNPGANASVTSLAVQGDGKILVGGDFTTLGGQTRNRIARLNADGTLDSSFNPGANASVTSLAEQDDGKILVGGFFISLGGRPRNFLARLNADGTVDSSFNPGANGSVISLALQTDGKILAGGSFTTLGGQTRDRIARLNADGTLDSSFNPGANDTAYSLAVQAEGKILVGGIFTTLGGETRNYIARLNADGTLDSTFNPGANSSVNSLALQADGKILVGGIFTTLGGQTRNRIARLLNDEAISSLSITGTSQIDWQRGGSTAEVEQVTFDFWNETGWTAAGTGARFAGGWRATGLSLPASTWVRARGRTGGGQYNGSSGLIEQIVSTNADLSALTLSTGSFSPTFASGTTTYTASVSNATTSLTVTPTCAQANATIEVRVNGGSYTSVTSGSPSGSLALNVGSNSIDIRVTAQAGNTKTYTVTVTRLAPPTVNSPTRASITTTGATLGGNVTADGGASITERGVVYSVTATNNNPTIGGGGVTTVTIAGTTGIFTTLIPGLTQGTGYSFKAFATNIEGTSYSNLATFVTDTTVALPGGIGTVTDRLIPAGDRQVFRFTLPEARMVNFTGTGASGFDWELRDASNAVVASGNGDVALARLLLAGDYSLVLTNATTTDATVSLNLDASVVAASRPDVQVGPTPLVPVGADQYTPLVQTNILTSRTARAVTGYARVGNDGNLPTVLRVLGTRGTTLFPVTYFGPLGTNPNANLTGQITAGTYATPNLENTSASVTIRVVIAPNKASIVSRRRVGTQLVTKTRPLTFNAVIRATSVSGPAATDSATIRVNTR